ncbi:MAG: hypothetical protein KAJ32_03460 [Gammaproteobacteria bacterium]|nr:hypothetical protein [Gammaproteobacteria bacterium]
MNANERKYNTLEIKADFLNKKDICVHLRSFAEEKIFNKVLGNSVQQ